MQLIQKIKRKSVTRNAIILLAAITLSAAVATDALAAGREIGGGTGRAGAHVTGPLPSAIPSMPPPVFNPSSPHTVSQLPKTHVSPAGPGSIFGNS